MRGVLTNEVKELSVELLGYEMSVKELRLLPYLMCCLIDNNNVSPNKINDEEREILSKWRANGWVDNPFSALGVSSEFYDMLVALLKVGYCSDMICIEVR
jgi:hypothetical protein